MTIKNIQNDSQDTGLAYGVSEAEAKGLCYDLALKTLKTTDGWHNHTVFIGTEINQDVLNQIAKETGLQ
jgi:hypothetical protein